MQKTFLANLFFVLLLNLIIKPLYIFGVEVSVQNTLGPAQYGLFFALLNSAYLFQIVNDFGLQIFNNRQVSIERGQLQELLPGLTVIKLIFSLLYVLLLTGLAFVLGYQDVLSIFLLVGLNLVLTSFILFVRSGISGLGYYRIDSVISIADKVLMILIIGGMLLGWRQEFGLLKFVLGQTLALVITLSLAFLVLFRLRKFHFRGVPLNKLRALLGLALPYAIAVFLMTLYTRSDGVMLKLLLDQGDMQAGIYAAGYRILDALNMVAFLFAAMLLPMFARSLRDPAALRGLVDVGARYMALLVFPSAILLVLYAHPVMSFLYTDADLQWSRVFSLLICTLVSSGMIYVFGTLLTASGQLRQMNFIYLITVCLNILLNFILIPVYEAWGAALATLVTQFFAAISILILALRKTEIGFPARDLRRLIVFIGLCGICFFMLRVVIPGRYWLLAAGVSAISTPLLARSVGLLRWSEFREMLSSR